MTKDIKPATKSEKLALLRRVSQQRATNLLPAVWTYLGRLIEDEEAAPASRLQASNMILDRALGKAKEIKEVDVNINVNAQHLDALKAINKAFRLEAEAQVLEVIDVTPDEEA